MSNDAASPIHEQVLGAVRRLCRERRNWRFSPDEIVRALPHLNASSVRTHIVSRCCVNAPRHHAHKWDYFRRTSRGVYEVLPAFRRKPAAARAAPAKPSRVAESGAAYRSGSPRSLRDTIHAVVSRDAGAYVGECLEIAVVTQGRTLSEVVHNLGEAVSLHLEGEDPGAFGLSASPRLVVTYEVPNVRDGAPA